MSKLLIAKIILNSPFVPLGSLQKNLVDHNYRIEYVEAFNDNSFSIDKNCDLLVVLGGPQSPYEIEKYPYLKKEQEWIKERIEKDQPTVGIAMGSQLIIQTMGGEVFPGSKKGLEFKIGWKKPTNTDSFFSKDSPQLFIWQNDFIELPRQAECLIQLAGDKYSCGAFRAKSNIYGFTYHAEVNQEIINKWIALLDKDLNKARVSPKKLIEETNENIERFLRYNDSIFDKLLQGFRKNEK